MQSLFKIQNKVTKKFWYLSEYNRTTTWLSSKAAEKNLTLAVAHWGHENTELIVYPLINEYRFPSDVVIASILKRNANA